MRPDPAATNPLDASGDVLARLLLAAREDPAFRNHLLGLVGLPAVHREALISTALQEMKLRGEPAELLGGFAALKTPGAAEAVRTFLTGK